MKNEHTVKVRSLLEPSSRRYKQEDDGGYAGRKDQRMAEVRELVHQQDYTRKSQEAAPNRRAHECS